MCPSSLSFVTKPSRQPGSARPQASFPTRAACALALLAGALCLSACGGNGEATITTSEAERPDPKPADPKPEIGDGEGGVDLAEIGTFDQPVYVTQPPSGDDALYVVEKAGRVMRVPVSGGEPAVFLDLSGEVSTGSEQGLLSIAFAPDYSKSGLLYTSFTDASGDSRVIEYKASGNRADPASGREVLAQDQPFSNHNGGLVLFDPGRDLVLGLGDGGSGGDPNRNAQDPSTLLGKLIEVDTSEAGDHRIIATGLRNPWRFSFDRETGDLWIGDVGQNEFEEIDSAAAGEIRGANFGWSAFEGEARFNSDQEAPGHVPPVHTYGREGGCSVTGGYVVRDARLESLYGRYLYGDYCEGELRSFAARPGEEATDDTALGPQVPELSSFGEDRGGRIYATSLEGRVYRLDPSGG